jgi:thiol-disulfide isomerase/thioredoxin
MNKRYFLYTAVAVVVSVAALYAEFGKKPSAPLASDVPVAVVQDPLARLFNAALTDLDGKARSMADWRGKPMVVNFWATWCAPCIKEMPELNAMQQRYQNVQFLGIGIDNADNMRVFVSKIPVSYPLLVAGVEGVDLTRELGNLAGGVPFTLVLDADGRITKKITGLIKFDELSLVLDGWKP